MAAPLFVDGLGSLFRCPCALGRRWSQPCCDRSLLGGLPRLLAASSAFSASFSARCLRLLGLLGLGLSLLAGARPVFQIRDRRVGGLPSMLVRIVFAGGIPRCWNATKSRTLTHRVLPFSATRASGDDAFTCSIVDDPRSIVRATRPSVPMLQPSASSAFTICLISAVHRFLSPSRRGRCLSRSRWPVCSADRSLMRRRLRNPRGKSRESWPESPRRRMRGQRLAD